MIACHLWIAIISFLLLLYGHCWGCLEGLSPPLRPLSLTSPCAAAGSLVQAWRCPGTHTPPPHTHPQHQVAEVKDDTCLTWISMPLSGIWRHAWLLLRGFLLRCHPVPAWCPSGHTPVPERVQGLRFQISSWLFIYRGRRAKWMVRFSLCLQFTQNHKRTLLWLLRPAGFGCRFTISALLCCC